MNKNSVMSSTQSEPISFDATAQSAAQSRNKNIDMIKFLAMLYVIGLHTLIGGGGEI